MSALPQPQPHGPPVLSRAEFRRRRWQRARKALGETWRLYRASRLGLWGLGIIAFFAALALAASLMPRIDPVYHPMMGFSIPLSPPTLEHPLGTDFWGRDILSQFMFGARMAFLVGITAAFIGVFLGTAVGLVSGYFGRAADSVLMRLTDVFLSLPVLPVLIIVAAILQKMSIWGTVVVIGLFSWPTVARIVRSQVLSLRTRPFVEAARVAGASHGRILVRHLLPNVLPLSFLYMTFGVVTAITYEAALSFLGFGDATVVSWGMMLQWLQTTGLMFGAPWWLLPPGLGISLLTLAFFLVGRALEEVIDPRLRER